MQLENNFHSISGGQKIKFPSIFMIIFGKTRKLSFFLFFFVVPIVLLMPLMNE